MKKITTSVLAVFMAAVSFGGVTTHLALDTRVGTRPAAEAESITYDPAWGDGSSVTVALDGETIGTYDSAGETTIDTTEWTDHVVRTLTHTSGDETLTAYFMLGEPGSKVSNLSVRQRYPWNGLVDIEFDLECRLTNLAFSVSVTAEDSVTGDSVDVGTIWPENGSSYDELSATAGYCHFIWDARSDAGAFVSNHVLFTVSVSPMDGFNGWDSEATATGPLDLRTGICEARPTERIVVSPAWAGSDRVSVYLDGILLYDVMANDERLIDTTGWAPGIHTLSCFSGGETLTRKFASPGYLDSDLPVLDHFTARQRYPWNGLVDISFNAAYWSSESDLWISLVARNRETGETLPLNSLFQDGDLRESTWVGTSDSYHLVWDAAAELPETVCESVDFVLTCGLASDEGELDGNAIDVTASGFLDTRTGIRQPRETEPVMVDPAWFGASDGLVLLDGVPLYSVSGADVRNVDTTAWNPGLRTLAFTAGSASYSVSFFVEDFVALTNAVGDPVGFQSGPRKGCWRFVSVPEETDGGYLRSGEIGLSTNSWMETTVEGPGRLTFDWTVSCNPRGHMLQWFLDGERQASITGPLTAWQPVSAEIGSGSHTIRFDYVKGSTSAAGEDRGAVDNFLFRNYRTIAVACEHGESFPADGTATVLDGDVVAASVREPDPADGIYYTCIGWEGTGDVPRAGTGTNFTFTVTGDSSIEWRWVTNFWTSFAVTSEGYSPFATGWYEAGTNLVVRYETEEPLARVELTGDVEGVAFDEAARTISFAVDRPRTLRLAVRSITLARVLDATNLVWSTSGAAVWTPCSDPVLYGDGSAKSGSVLGDDESILEAELVGPGTLSWYWRLDAEGVAGVECYVDGVWTEYLYDSSDWTQASVSISGAGPHTVRFVFWNAGTEETRDDCAYLDRVEWSGASSAADDRPAHADRDAWIRANAAAILAACGGDCDAAAAAKAANGINTVGECYVAGLDPTDPDSRFRATIQMEDGSPKVGWEPDLGSARQYEIQGKTNLADAVWTTPPNGGHRFFRVRVDDPGESGSAETVHGFVFEGLGGQVETEFLSWADWARRGTLPGWTDSDLYFDGWYIARRGGRPYDPALDVVPSNQNLLLYARSRDYNSVWYVDGTAGNDAADGRTRATAKRTIQAAVDAAATGDVVFVAPGTYAPIATGNKRIRIESEAGAESTIIDAGRASRCATLAAVPSVPAGTIPIDSYWDHCDGTDFLENQTDTKLVGFTLRNGYAGGDLGGGALGGTLDRCILSDNEACFGGGAAYARLSNSLVLRNHSTMGDVGDWLPNSGGAYDSVLDNCTLYGNFGADAGVASGSTLRNCIIALGGAECLFGFHNECSYCVYDGWSPETFSYWGMNELDHCIQADPCFANAAANDFRPSPGSPCIDAGQNEFSVGDTDLGSVPRMQGGTVDIGAFEAYEYTIVFHPNGGTGTMPDESFTYGTMKALSSNAFTRTGYTFAGWATSAAADPVYADGQTVLNLTKTVGGTVRLYAKWVPNSYSVAFHANGGTGTMPAESFTYGTPKALSANVFTRDGYVFGGWATSTSGEAVYSDGQSVLNLSSAAGATVTLYAVWEKDHGGVQLWEGGPFWAESNVGAANPQDYGYYFWWGDTVGYTYDGSQWNAADGSSANFLFSNFDDESPAGATMWKDKAALRSEGWTDPAGNLVAAHDAAATHLGAPWRMPTASECDALITHCDTEWTTQGGVFGLLATGRGEYASKSIFLPAAGSGSDNILDESESTAAYWSSTPNFMDSGSAWGFSGNSDYFLKSMRDRFAGLPIRPVRDSSAVEPDEVSLESALDNESLTFTTGGDAEWFGQTVESRDDVDAAQSGRIDDNRASWMETTVSGSGTVTFWWKASSESGWDQLRFYIDGTEAVEPISGNTGWSQVSKTIDGAGPHTLRWSYEKDGGGSNGDDCGWVDRVVWMPRSQGEPGGVQLWENGPYWAECNVGAAKPESSGFFFWWGDTTGYGREGHAWIASDASQTYFSFSIDNCPTYDLMNSQLSATGWIDSTGNLVATHDGATARLGAPWRLPTEADWTALVDKCTATWTTSNGVPGLLVTGKDAFASKSIFLPAAGYGFDFNQFGTASDGFYWSSTPDSDDSGSSWVFYFDPEDYYLDYFYRERGYSVRPLRDSSEAGSSVYVVRFHANGGSGSMADQSFTVGTAQALPANTFTREGYAFVGWATSSTGSAAYSDRQSVSNLTTTAGATVTLYAVWEKDYGGVQLWENGPYWAECNVGSTKPEKCGYYFAWGNSVGCTLSGDEWVFVDGSEKGFPYGWGAYPGRDVMDDLDAAHDAATAYMGAPWRMPTSDDFDALAKNCTIVWTTKNGVFGCLVTGRNAYSGKSIFLPAGGYVGDDGLEDQGTDGYYWSSSPFTREFASYAGGYHFDSTGFWYWENYCYYLQPVRGLRGFGEYAYSVRFNANGGEGAMPDESFLSGKSQALSPNAFTWTGHTFVGWATSATGEVMYSDRQFVSDLANAPDATVTLYAVWTEGLIGVQLWKDGPFWMECNVGASKPEESGYRFWWGDTIGYKQVGDGWNAVDGSQTGFSFDSQNCPTVWKDVSQLRSEGWIDSSGNLSSSHDAATKHLGAPWKMPTRSDFDELIEHCDATWTIQGGVHGCLVRGRGEYVSKSVFFPADDKYGEYWSSTPNPDESDCSYYGLAWSWDMERGDYGKRYNGYAVRALRNPSNEELYGWTLAMAVDNESLTFTTGGEVDWRTQTATSHDGVDAAQSGKIGDNQTSWMQATVSGPGTVTFWWKASSESGRDPLKFFVDGSEATTAISGESGWAQVSKTIDGAGSHTLRWSFEKDESIGEGDDCGWVDQVVWVENPGGVQLWENGPYWAECNVGATKPEEYGYYFRWGDTVGCERVGDSWNAVDGTQTSFSVGNCPTYEKDNSQLQSEGWIDGSGNLVAAHDAATAHLGAPWRMPTRAEWSALRDNCYTEWTTRDGVFGRLVKGRGAYATKSIFLPAGGYGTGSSLETLGTSGWYWSSTPRSDTKTRAEYLDFSSNGFLYGYYGYRYWGKPIRPLRDAAQ